MNEKILAKQQYPLFCEFPEGRCTDGGVKWGKKLGFRLLGKSGEEKRVHLSVIGRDEIFWGAVR